MTAATECSTGLAEGNTPRWPAGLRVASASAVSVVVLATRTRVDKTVRGELDDDPPVPEQPPPRP